MLNLITKYQPGLQSSLTNSQELVLYKLSSNENLLGTSKFVKKELQINHGRLERYPGNISNELIKAIANMYNLIVNK